MRHPRRARRTRGTTAGQEDSRWLFHQDGEPLPEEDTARYGERIKRKRMNEAVMMQLLDRLGASYMSTGAQEPTFDELVYIGLFS